MNVANIYRKLKQILEDANVALTDRGLDEVSSLSEIPVRIANKTINRLPYFVNGDAVALMEQDFPLEAFSAEISSDFHFSRYTNLASVTIPRGVQNIGSDAFISCGNLISVTIPGSVQSIGDYAFAFCSSLTSITIPNSVQSIGSNAFENCDKIKTVYLNCSIPPSLGNINSMPQNAIIHVPIGSGNAYKSATNWSYYANYIIEDVKI